jgi:hypothetical protein
VTQITRAPIGCTLRAAHRQYLGSYIVSINGHPVFSESDIDSALAAICAENATPATVELVLAPERKQDFDDRPSPIHLCMHDL